MIKTRKRTVFQLAFSDPYDFNLSWVKFPAACCDKSELNPKNMILRGLPRRDFILAGISLIPQIKHNPEICRVNNTTL
jgi:hypothetical protein